MALSKMLVGRFSNIKIFTKGSFYNGQSTILLS